MKKAIIILFAILFPCLPSLSQEKKKFLTLDGYVSSMQSVMFDSLSGEFLNDNLIHNRLNLKGYINDNFTFGIDLRNRLFTGDMVKLMPGYPVMISNDRGLLDMSWNILERNSFFLNTTVDRLWMDFTLGKFEIRAGRQRINWGQTLVWNPNDIFNSYSFFDFDYVERPGSDAVRLQYYPGSLSEIDVAVKADHFKKVTAAALVRFNRLGYDLQFIAGYSGSTDLVAGLGWSGSLGSVSFRGEATWFQPAKQFSDTTGRGILTFGLDRTFKKGSMAQFQLMFCNNPVNPGDFSSFYYGSMSAKELAFSKFTAFGSFSYPVTPLFNATLSAMWFPELEGYFAGPSIDYALARNIDLSILWQHFTGNISSQEQNINLGFLRFKISF
jgi:hypothetical protein